MTLSIKKSLTWTYLAVGTVVMHSVAPREALAAYNDVSAMATGLDSTIKALAPVASKGFALLGFILAGFGMYKLWNASQGTSRQGGGYGSAILCILAGAMLMALAAFSDTLSATMTGGDATGLDELGM